MDIFSGIFFGIAAMICWGLSDFFVTKSARGCDPLKAFFWSQLVALGLMLIVFYEFFELPSFSIEVIILLLASGFFTVVANLSFYKSLRQGKVSIVMPIASCWAVVTVILSLIFLGESLTVFKTVGVIIAIVGVLLVSFKWKDIALDVKKHTAGVKYAAIAALAYGADFTVIDLAAKKIGWFLLIFFVGLITACYLLAYAGIKKKDISFPKNALKFIFSVGVLDTIAYLLYASSVTREYGAVVAPIAAASPAVSILLARIFFKEKLEINQEIGMILVLVSLILLAV